MIFLLYFCGGVWCLKYSEIILFYTQLSEKEPKVDLTIQDPQENSHAVWVPKHDLWQYIKDSTEVAFEAVEYWLKMDQEVLDEGAYLATQTKNWSKMKKKLIGYGKNKHTGGGKGHTRPSFEKSKAAPPDFAVLEKKEEKKKKLKVKINKKKH